MCKLAANRPGTRSAQDGIRGMECGTKQGQTSCGNWLGSLFVCVFSVSVNLWDGSFANQL